MSNSIEIIKNIQTLIQLKEAVEVIKTKNNMKYSSDICHFFENRIAEMALGHTGHVGEPYQISLDDVPRTGMEDRLKEIVVDFKEIKNLLEQAFDFYLAVIPRPYYKKEDFIISGGFYPLIENCKKELSRVIIKEVGDFKTPV